MSRELINERSVINALIKLILDEFPDVRNVRTEWTPPADLGTNQFPFAYIQLINMIPGTRLMLGKKPVTYHYVMQHHLASNPLAPPTVGQQARTVQADLDRMTIGLERVMDYLEVDGIPIATNNRRSQKVEGVLHYFFSVTIWEEPKSEEREMMETLDLNLDIVAGD